MISRDDRSKLINRLKSFPSELRATIDKLPESKIDTPYGPGKWTPRQVVHHLVDSHLNGFLRVRWALTEDNPTIKPYDQDKFAELPDYKIDLDSSFMILEGLHLKWAVLYENLTEEQWQRPVTHPDPDYGNVEEILIAYVGHGDKHIGHIKQLL